MINNVLKPMQLYWYQKEAVDAPFKWWAAGRIGEDPLIRIPTAGGKTIVFSEIIKRLLREYHGVNVLVLAHRKELISQAEQKLLSVWPDAPVGVYAASLNRREVRRITIASRDTIINVIDEIGQFTFVIVDEAHRISNKEEGQYRKLISALRQQYNHLVVIGFTATPFRLGQGKIYGEGKPFADLAYSVGMLELIEQGFLSPLTSIAPVNGKINTDGVKLVAGEFNEKQLTERATAEGVIESAISEWLDTAYLQGRQSSVFFCVSVVHAEKTVECLRQKSINAFFIDGKTKDTERAQILSAFDAGEFPALVSVNVLTEGWDCPRVDCIVLMRSTHSAAAYCQMIGRGLRLFNGKTNCLILDFGGNIERLGPVDLAGESEPKKKKGKQEEKGEAPYKRCGEWSHRESTFVGGCGHKNPPAASKCEKCGQLFIRHCNEAKHGGIVSTERVLEDFVVERVSYGLAVSRATGNQYLRIIYHCGIFDVFYKNIMLSYPGYAGNKALKEWVMLTNHGTLPDTPQQAVLLLDSKQESLKQPHSITVDVASRWKDIVRFDFN